MHDVQSMWMAAMRAGDFEAAWKATDEVELLRRAARHEPGFMRDPSHLVWDGTPFDGRIVLVRCLHGLGDTLQFMRFVPQLEARARKLHFLAQPMLLPLLDGAPGLGIVSNAWTDAPPAADVEIEVMELAYALRAKIDTLPPPYPHLAARLQSLARSFPVEDTRLRVGLIWAASDWDATRSLQVAELEPLLRVPGTAFYSLQQGAPSLDPAVARLGITALSSWTRAIEDAAAAMLQMDVVVSVDGMPAHLAGTLGRPTLLLLKHDADWRWMDERAATPWYPSMRLFRQARAGDWQSVVGEVAAAVRNMRRR